MIVNGIITWHHHNKLGLLINFSTETFVGTQNDLNERLKKVSEENRSRFVLDQDLLIFHSFTFFSYKRD